MMRFKVIWILLFSTAQLLSQQKFTVNTSHDTPDHNLADQKCEDKDGKCSLRAALENANKYPDKDSIHFNIPGNGIQVLKVQHNLPKIIFPIVLDATTQRNYTFLTPQIKLDGRQMDSDWEKYDLDPDNIPTGLFLDEQSGGSLIKGLIIGGFGCEDPTGDFPERPGRGTGISIISSNNIIESCFVGIEPNAEPFRNSLGILVDGQNNLIGGKKDVQRNIISANTLSGILTYDSNIIKGNFIGTDASGEKILHQKTGILLVRHSDNNIISSNLISGNEKGIGCSGDSNMFYNNYVGTNKTGNRILGNKIGINIQSLAKDNLIGRPYHPNLVSGNKIGILISNEGADRVFSKRQFLEMVENQNTIVSNIIGLNVEGQYGLGNETGIQINQSSSNIIGGTFFREKNIISGNLKAGIEILDSSNTILQNNCIGTNISGEISVPNGTGIIVKADKVVAENNNIIDNIISGNKNAGIVLSNDMNICIQGNRIGVSECDNKLPNGEYGIMLDYKNSACTFNYLKTIENNKFYNCLDNISNFHLEN